jgi:hypothetical protein
LFIAILSAEEMRSSLQAGESSALCCIHCSQFSAKRKAYAQCTCGEYVNEGKKNERKERRQIEDGSEEEV